MNKFNELRLLINSIEPDAEKFFNKGNKAAGMRVRAHFQKVKILAQTIRTSVIETKTKELNV